MKNIFLAFVLLIGFSLYVNAQDPIKLFGHGEITLKDGTHLKGVIKYSPQTPTKVHYKEESSGKWKKYNSKEAASFLVEDRLFESKLNKGALASNPNYFMELIVPTDYKMKVYRYTEQNATSTTGDYSIKTEYFVQFPGEENLLNVNSMKLQPFHKKGPQYIGECEVLTDRIVKKANGYKISMMSSEVTKVTVLKQVAEDYQNCN